MSVGVCIINRNGIALAADSAGTLNGDNPNENKMFYNSMNKVFSLSEEHAYGVITYGGTTIYNVSVEQILKEFSVYLSSGKEIDDFFELLTLFQKFIEENNRYYKFDVAERGYCETIIKELVGDYGKKIKSVLGDEEPQKSIDKILLDLENVIAQGAKPENYDVAAHIDATYKKQFDKYVNMMVPELKNFPAQKQCLWDKICRYFNLFLKIESENPMGLLFAGYGKKDAFPKFIHIELLKVINGKLKYNLIKKYEESDNSAQIYPLAQTDVIYTFCKGISNTFIEYIPKKTASLIADKINALSDRFSDEQKQELKQVMSSCSQELLKSLNTLIRNSNVDPLLTSVQLIPLSEMAILAENLVNITSLRRTFVLDGNQLTVGGPTDVAVLSKGDGFRWVKNKNQSPALM